MHDELDGDGVKLSCRRVANPPTGGVCVREGAHTSIFPGFG